MYNVEVTGTLVADVFITHYQQFLDTSRDCEDLDTQGLFINRISDESSHDMVGHVMNNEVKQAMFSIGDDRALSPDGFTSAFFKKSLDVVGPDIYNAVTCAGPPRCAFKVDIQKAYDTVDWKFLGNILKCFGFHDTMIKWIMACVKSASFSLGLNGDIHDDLFIFARGELDSARLIIESLDEFQKSSGLVPSIPKSTTYFYNVRNHVKHAILNLMPFAEGELPVKYLGVPLISTSCVNLSSHLCMCIGHRFSSFLKIHIYKLRGRTIWDVPIKADMSWGWRKLLQIRECVRQFFWCQLGNGKTTSLWYDRWCTQGLIIRYLSPRDITNEGYRLQNCIADLVSNEGWSWPQAWLLKAPDLGSIPVPVLVDSQLDKPQWRDINGNLSNFSVKCAWEALRPRDIEVPWHQLVWFSHCIPRHAFNLWLIMKNSLKTHDQLRQWDVRIFFSNMGMENVLPSLHDIVSHLLPLAHKRSAKSVIGRLLVVAASYFIWIEHNNRIFKKVKRSPEDLCDTIMVMIRLKLLTFRFKNTKVVNELLSK
ncbi:retrotransposon protein, putative, ty1-copia subclass [Tanacetum coccineum]